MPLTQRQPDSTPAAHAAAAVLLRIHRPDEAEPPVRPAVSRRGFLRTAAAVVAAAAAPAVTEAAAIAIPTTAVPPLSPQMRLTEFFEEVYVPKVMQLRNRNSIKTIDQYRTSLKWWTELTGDPPLCEITDETLYDKFADGLRHAVYCKGLNATPRAMRQSTAVKHMKHVRAVYFRTGPKKADPKRPGFGVLPEIEHLEIESPTDARMKPPITPTQAQAIFAACEHMKYYGTKRERLRIVNARHGGHLGDGGPGGDKRWRSLIATFYYGGRRFESVQGLRWRMMKFVDGRPFWDIPAGCVKGKKRGDLIYIHPHAYELLALLPRESEDDLVYPFLSEHSHGHLGERHAMLQDFADLGEHVNDFHGWKRGFVTQRFALGLKSAVDDARRAARHGDEETTTKFYVEVEPMLIDLFAPLDPDWTPQRRLSKGPAANQLSFF